MSVAFLLGLQAEFSSTVNVKEGPYQRPPSLTESSDSMEVQPPTESPDKTVASTYPLLKSLQEKTSAVPVVVSKAIPRRDNSDSDRRLDEGSGKMKKKNKNKKRKSKLSPGLASLTSFMKVHTPNGRTGTVKVKDKENDKDVTDVKLENEVIRIKDNMLNKDDVKDEDEDRLMSSNAGKDENKNFEDNEDDYKDEREYFYDDDYGEEHVHITDGMENIRFEDDHEDMNISDYSYYEEDLGETDIWDVGNNQPFGSMPDDFKTLQGQSFSGAFFGSHGYVGFDTSYPHTHAVSGCPESCRCFKTQVACSGQNFTSVPKGMSPLTTEL